MTLAHQIVVVCYRKTGNHLFGGILRDLARTLHLGYRPLYGLVPAIPPDPDMVMLGHGLLGIAPARPFRGVRIVRDPRDIWVSGYLYHLRCKEPWCLSTDFSPQPPIDHPRVPGPFVHRRERYKRDYLARLNGRSYQENLRTLDRAAGLAFELAGHTGCTLEDIANWRFHDPRVLDVRIEQVSADFDGSMARIFAHLGFTGEDLAEAVEIAEAHDVARMTNAAIARNPHIQGRELSKWRGFLTPAQLTGFEARYGGLIRALGYPLSTDTA